MVGQIVSHYKILEKLGEGGMGVVYKAEDTNLDRLVALKFLPAHLAASEQDKARFTQEAKAASALNHPNVCTIHDIQEHQDQMFIVMEFVDGQTLADKKGTIGFKQIIDIGIQIADGLAAAHEKGIVHRDIKPENIMVRKDGIAQIMDFGLAKLRGVSKLTKEGSTIGTAGYMSPEQVQGQATDQRSDIFSLGVLLYELFTGQLPFKGVHETALMYEIVNVETPPMSSIKPEIDSVLDSIVLECLEKDPNERTQSAKQVAIDLKRCRRESLRQRVTRATAVHPTFETVRRNGVVVQAATSSKVSLLVIVFLLLVLIPLAWIALKHRPAIPSVVRFSINLPTDQVLSMENHPAVAVSPDGSRLICNAGGKFYQKKIDSYLLEPIPGTEDGDDPFFSPDGRWLGFFSGGKLKKIPLNGGAAVILADILTDRGGAWTKDGTVVFSPSGREGLSRIKEDGSDLQELTQEDTTRNERTHRWPQTLPDGKTVIFTVGFMGSPDYYEDASIWAANISTGERKLIFKGASSARYLPNGFLAYTHAGTLFAVPFDLDRLEVKGSSFPLIDNIANDMATGAYHVAWSDNGTLAYVPGGSSTSDRVLALIDRKGGSTLLQAPPRPYVDPRISPDGRRIAIVVQAGKGFDIWIYEIKRNTMSRLTFGGSNRSPVWSPDGKRIAYSNNTSAVVGKSKVSIIQADGSGTPQDIIMDFDRTYVNSWAPDGSVLIVTVPQKGMGWDLWALPLDGNRKPWPYLSTKFDESFASLSPDGKWLAYTSNETGVAQIYVRPFPRGDAKWQISAEALFSAVWSRNGRTLYYVSKRGIVAVPITGIQTLTAGEPRVVIKDFQGPLVESSISFDVMPGEQSILVTQPKDGDKASQQINVVVNWLDEVEKLAAGK